MNLISWRPVAKLWAGGKRRRKPGASPARPAAAHCWLIILHNRSLTYSPDSFKLFKSQITQTLFKSDEAQLIRFYIYILFTEIGETFLLPFYDSYLNYFIIFINKTNFNVGLFTNV